jgi:hypothetical protein
MTTLNLQTFIVMRNSNHLFSPKLFMSMRTAKNSKLSLPFGVFVLVFCLLNGTAWGQLNVNAANTPFVIDFSTTVSGVNNGAFNPGANGGNVTNNTPAAGQLEGNALALYQ